MNWTTALIVLAFFVLLYLLKRVGQISAQDAQRHLQNGAIVIDVRSPAEFNSSHLPSAINLPLDDIEVQLPRRFANKNLCLLLHCQSGMRSGVAKKKLQALGYRNSFNLGSYQRAASIVGQP